VQSTLSAIADGKPDLLVTPSAPQILAALPQLAQGPDLSSLPNEGQSQRVESDDELSLSKSAFGSLALILPTNDSAISGIARFQDTTTGIVFSSYLKGLQPGKAYYLHLDELAHGGPHIGATCRESEEFEQQKKKIDKQIELVPWRIGPLIADNRGVARLDRFYPGISSDGPYKVPATPVLEPGGPQVTIRLSTFSLLVRRLTVHRLPDAPPFLLAEKAPLGCAIINDDGTYGKTKLKPLPGHTASGSFVLQHDESNRASMSLKLSNIPPGNYAVVAYEFGDCGDQNGVGFGEPYQPPKNIVTFPKHDWPLHNGLIDTFTVDESRSVFATKDFDHPLTNGSPAAIIGRAIVIVDLNSPTDASRQPTPIACGALTPW
jgi:hypothetical protein